MEGRFQVDLPVYPMITAGAETVDEIEGPFAARALALACAKAAALKKKDPGQRAKGLWIVGRSQDKKDVIALFDSGLFA
jgi:hypothetical protein